MAAGRPAIDESVLDEELSADADASGTLPSGSSDRLRLRTGEIDATAYLELQIERALAPYRGVVAEPLLEAMRDVLRAQLESDPALNDLAARATQIES